MASLVVKGLSGAALAGILGGSSYGIYSLTSTNDKIQNYLLKNGYSITNFDKSELWKKVYETYKLEKDQEGLEIRILQ